jgi:hypothetical protein
LPPFCVISEEIFVSMLLYCYITPVYRGDF